MKCNHIVLSVIFSAVAFVSGAYGGGADEIIKALQANPDDKVQLQKLKGSLSGITDPGAKCRYGVIYCLGMLSLNEMKEGLTVRSQIARAYPGNPLLSELSDQGICDACGDCSATGKCEAGCKACKASGTCASCGGSGVGKGKGFDGKELRCAACGGSGKCAICSGTGKVNQACKKCSGSGYLLSKEKCMEAYHRLLK